MVSVMASRLVLEAYGPRRGGDMRVLALTIVCGVLISGCGSATPAAPESSAPASSAPASPTLPASPTPVPSPSSPSAPAEDVPTKDECKQIWNDYQYGDIAPGFPTEVPEEDREALLSLCESNDLMPTYDEQYLMTQQAFNTTAQLLEKEISKVSKKTGKPPCEALIDVLKPVGANGKPLMPGDDVEGYAPDSFLPILRYNWYGGPFRLKFGVGCGEYPYANLWFFADPYPPPDSHPERYPTDEEVKKDPWPRTPFGGAMSTCITWGPELGNDGVGGRGFIFGFDWDLTNLPNMVESCYPKALGLEGLGEFPLDEVPNL